MQRFVFEKNGLFWWVYENTVDEKNIVCVCVYKKGAVEVVRRLNEFCGLLDGKGTGEKTRANQ